MIALGLHFVFWSAQRPLPLGYVVLGVGFVALSRLQKEGTFWGTMLAAIVGAFVVAPPALSVVLLLTALSCGYRAFARVRVVPAPEEAQHDAASGARRDPSLAEVARDPSPYREVRETPYDLSDRQFADRSHPPRILMTVVAVDAAARLRFLTGSVFGIYLAVWTLPFAALGPFPAHVLALDLALGVCVALFAWRLRARLALSPLAVAYMHGVLASGLVPRPTSLLGWGGSAVALGFVLLAVSVALSYRFRVGSENRAESDNRAPR